MVSFLDIVPTCIDWAGKTDADIATSNTGKSPRRLGKSFLPILRATDVLPGEEWTQHVFGSHTFHEIQNYWPTRFMRTERFKYHRNIAWKLDFPFGTDIYGSLSWEGIRNSAPVPDDESDTPEVMIGRRRLGSYLYRGPEELFDLEVDPEEINNLASKPEYQDQLLLMRRQTEEWQYLTDDVWLFKDGVSAIVSQGYQSQGLKLPDRFDFDITRPGNRDGSHWAPAEAKTASEGTTKMG
jgi:N-sulfoglucosamine sulfohydrolase